MQKNSVLEALKKASEVCKIKKTEIWVCENQEFLFSYVVWCTKYKSIDSTRNAGNGKLLL